MTRFSSARVFIPAIVGILALTAASAASARVLTTDTFTQADEGWAEGSQHGRFTVVFNGYGTVGVVGQKLRLSPQAATAPAETHAALVTSPVPKSDVDFTVEVTTVAQLRTGTAPNPWESGWVMWNYAGNDHLTYLAIKPNGWEIGRRDPNGAGGQIYIATGELPATPIGVARNVRVRHIGNRLSIWIDGGQIFDRRNVDPVVRAAVVALYTEDATVDFDNLAISST